MFLPAWTYDGRDPGLRLFTLANEKLPEAEGEWFWEIGCCDTDFMERVRRVRPSARITGIDWRQRAGAQQADILTASIPSGTSYDAVIALSTVEHIGLGHYDRDPIDPYGDIKAVQRVREYIHRNGFFYFDVPYAPEGYFVKGTKCRVYDDQALKERFGPHKVLGYTLPSVDGWIEKPTVNCQQPKPYYYVALLIRKDGN